MHMTFLEGGQPIRIEVFEPDLAPGETVPAVLLLHGAGGNTAFWMERIVPQLARVRVAIYAVQYFDRTGTTRADLALLTDGVHIPQWLETIRAAVAWVQARPGVDAERLALLGVSLGAFLGLALAALPQSPALAAIVEVSGGLVEPYAAQAGAGFPPTLILHGDHDHVVAISHAHELDALLARLKVDHETHILAGEGHWFSTAAQAQLLSLTAAFLARYLSPRSPAQPQTAQPVQVLQ